MFTANCLLFEMDYKLPAIVNPIKYITDKDSLFTVNVNGHGRLSVTCGGLMH